jgi:putative hydrolase of the HAD superfamily
MRPELPPGPRSLAPAELTAALLDALRFTAFPDAAPALQELRALGHRLVVVSNWDVSLEERLAETDLLELVDAAVASAPFGAAKPARAIFEHALELAGADSGAAWHVGDDLTADVGGARAAGIRPVYVDRRGRGGAPAGVPVVRDLDPLPEMLATAGPYA